MNSYLADYEKQHPTHSDRVYCNNYALNAILSFYADKAESAGIQFDIHIQLSDPPVIPETKLCVLLGNLLENALDACRECTDTAPFIRIRAREEGGHIALAVDNTCCRAPMEENGRFRSSKHEGFGTGTASVRSIAQRYHGVTEFHYQDHIFFASVFL